ncbi:initiator tRNA phosphoribosyl transferase [Cyathus striatus]|nr:initiator tRNA phosphoribosyl transferase [Cyathus striatus]
MNDNDVLPSFQNIKHIALDLIRKESLDIYNRLHSVIEDVTFVQQVHEAYSDIPLLPNLRCGEWYTDPKIANPTPAYFKSTDGHFNNWSFSLRRANLHLLPLVVEYGGLILVDSTRAGKRMPDALSKTVPIWCAVINRAMLLIHPELNEVKTGWNTKLYTPPGIVSAQEHRQIELRLDGWAETLSKSSFKLSKLPYPLRPLWITPTTSTFPSLPSKEERVFLPVICLSASKQIQEGAERRVAGFTYIQGSGDDHELWGMGLVPDLFWEHKDRLISASRGDLPGLAASIVQEASRSAKETKLPTPVEKIGGRLMICSLSDLLRPLESFKSALDESISYILIMPNTRAIDNATSLEVTSSNSQLVLELPEGKKGASCFLSSILPSAMPFIRARLSEGQTICVACESGKDASVGVVLAALGMFFDDDGKFLSNSDRPNPNVNKQTLHTRLEWIVSSRPEANPYRTTLKKVNEFLLTPPSIRKQG